MIWDDLGGTCSSTGVGREWCFLESCAGQRRGDDVGPGEKTAQLGQKEALDLLSLSGLCLPGGGSPDRELRSCTAALHNPCRRHAAHLLGGGLCEGG